jgi:hypothetical protein
MWGVLMRNKIYLTFYRNTYVQVHFKRAHRNFLLSPSAPRNILPGDFVKVEADRGEDLGVVVSKSLVADFVEFVPTAGYRGRGYSAGLGEKKYIIRFATAEERMLLRNKVEDEERTLQVSDSSGQLNVMIILSFILILIFILHSINTILLNHLPLQLQLQLQLEGD